MARCFFPFCWRFRSEFSKADTGSFSGAEEGEKVPFLSSSLIWENGRVPYMSYSKLLEKDPYAHTKNKIGKVNYNGVSMIKKKTLLAIEKCGGVMIWELSQDAVGEHSLLKAIDDTLIQQKKN